MKYTRELLEAAVRESVSIRGVLDKLGLKMSGGSHGHIKRRIKEHRIDMTHFHGKGSNRGPVHAGGLERLRPEDIFVYNRCNGLREKPRYLRQALLSVGVEERCVECGQGSEWNGRPLRLPVDHKNGDFLDCRRENLRFMCPNCHSQTETFGSKRRIQ